MRLKVRYDDKVLHSKLEIIKCTISDSTVLNIHIS